METQEVLFSSQNLDWHHLSMIYVEEIYKELTDNVTKYLRVPTPQTIQQEIDRINDSAKAFSRGTQINFILTKN